jgi:hypothetical protein
MATKSFNPLKNPYDALQLLLALSSMENRQQALRAASVVKAKLDAGRGEVSELATLRGQNDVLRQQIETLKAEVSAYQFQFQATQEAPVDPVLVTEDKRRGRKSNAN